MCAVTALMEKMTGNLERERWNVKSMEPKQRAGIEIYEANEKKDKKNVGKDDVARNRI